MLDRFTKKRNYNSFKSQVARDILCGLGFCICDENNYYSLCCNIKPKRSKFIDFDHRIPKRYRKCEYITERQLQKRQYHSLEEKHSHSDTECYSKKKGNYKRTPVNYEVEHQGKISRTSCMESIDGLEKSIDSFPCYPISKKALIKQKAKENCGILYFPGVNDDIQLGSIDLEFKKLENLLKNEKLFLLPNPDKEPIHTSVEQDIKYLNLNNDNDAFNPYILPDEQLDDSESSINAKLCTLDNKIYSNGVKTADELTDYSSKNHADVSKISNETQEGIDHLNLKKTVIDSIENKLDIIINEIHDLKISINNKMQTNLNCIPKTEDVEVECIKVFKKSKPIRSLKVNDNFENEPN